MRRTRLVLMLFCCVGLVLAACGDDGDGDIRADVDASPPPPTPDAAPPTPDAAPPTPDAAPDAAPVDPFACLGMPIPPAEGATVTINGDTFTVGLGGNSPVTGATVSGFLVGDTMNPLETTTSDANGVFTMTTNTMNGMALDAYIHATHPNFLDSYVYPPVPIFQETFNNASTVMLDRQQIDLIAQIGGTSQTVGAGFMVVAVVDCGGNPLAGATVTANPPAGATRYAQGGVPDQNANATDASGLAFLFDVQPGSVQIDAEVNAMSLREHTVDVVADATTTSLISP